MTFTKDTLIPISAVSIVLAAGFSYGILYNKVNTLTDEVAGLRADTKALIITVNQLVGSSDLSYGYPVSH